MTIDRKIIREYDLARVLYCKAWGKTEEIDTALAISAALTREYGLTPPRGIYVPTQVLAAGMGFARALDTTNGVGLINTTDADPIAALVAGSVLGKAGARAITRCQGKVIIPRELTAADPQWVEEGGNLAESSTTYDRVTATPHTIAASTVFTRPMLEGISERNRQFVAAQLARALMAGLEKAVFSGTGTDGEPLGIDNAEGITELSFTEDAPTRAEVLAAFDAVANATENPENLVWVMHPSVAKKFMETFEIITTDNGEIGGGYLMTHFGGRRFLCDGVPVLVSTLATEGMIYIGDWTKLLLAYFGPGVDIVPTIANSLVGTVRVAAFLDCDIILGHEAAFGVGRVLAEPEPDEDGEGDGEDGEDDGEGGEGGEGGGEGDGPGDKGSAGGGTDGEQLKDPDNGGGDGDQPKGEDEPKEELKV